MKALWGLAADNKSQMDPEDDEFLPDGDNFVAEVGMEKQ